MDIRLLMRKKDELLAKRQAILDKLVEEGRGYTDEEQEEDERLQKEIAGYDMQIHNAQEIERQRLGIPKDQETPTMQSTDPEQSQADQKKWPNFGEFLQAVVRAGTPGQRVDPRLITSPEERAMGMSEGVPAEGGFLVQTDVITELLKKTFEAAILGSRVRKVTVGANSNGLVLKTVDETSRATGSRWGGVKAYWAAEAGAKTASMPKFGELELKLKKIIGLCYTTDELLQDAAALEAIISQAFSEEFSWMIDESIFTGTGVGQPLGILNSPSLVTVAKEAGQPAATILYQNIMKMYSRMWGRSRPSGIWLINQDIEPQLHAMAMAVGAGGVPVYMPAGGLSASPYGKLYGLPVIPNEHSETLGTVGDIVFADMSQYIMIDKGGAGGGIQTASSIHVKFLYDETAFRFVLRVDGQPLWSTTLTPAKGANTLSPFVALATRA